MRAIGCLFFAAAPAIILVLFLIGTALLPLRWIDDAVGLHWFSPDKSLMSFSSPDIKWSGEKDKILTVTIVNYSDEPMSRFTFHCDAGLPLYNYLVFTDTSGILPQEASRRTYQISNSEESIVENIDKCWYERHYVGKPTQYDHIDAEKRMGGGRWGDRLNDDGLYYDTHRGEIVQGRSPDDDYSDQFN